jgi:hypothetical protein
MQLYLLLSLLNEIYSFNDIFMVLKIRAKKKRKESLYVFLFLHNIHLARGSFALSAKGDNFAVCLDYCVRIIVFEVV